MLKRKIATFVPEFGKRVMKRYIIHYIYLFLGASVLSFFSACQSNTRWNELAFYNVEKQEQISEEPTKEVDMGDADDTMALLHEKGKREMDVKVDMQFIQSDNEANVHVCKLINDQLIELLLKQSSELSIDEAIAQYIEDVKTDFHGDEVANVYYDHLTGRAEYGMENIINYRLVEDVFTGGAHPCTVTTILRFHAQTGEFIGLEQVFPIPNQQKLQELLLEKLMRSNGAHTMEELQKKGFLEMNDMFVSTNFAMREDSIEFYYNEYDIAPYANGACTICVGYEEVKDLMGTGMVTEENRR